MIVNLRYLSLLLLLPPSAGAQDVSKNTKQSPVVTQANPILAQANAALEARDYERALKLLTQLAEENPKDATILYDLGTAQDALDQNAPAEQSYRAAIVDDPKLIAPHVALGLLLARNDRRGDARTELAAAVALPDPAAQTDKAQANDLKAHAYRALARLDQTARPGDARDELLAALKLSPETPDDTIMAAELAAGASGGVSAAEAAYRRVLATHPDDPSAVSGLAHLLGQSERAAEAEAMLTVALKAHPHDPQLTAELASVYTSERKTAEALPLVAELRTKTPDNVDLTHLLAELYLESNDYGKAEPLLATLSMLRPKDTSVADDRARALLHLHNPAEAERILTPMVAQPALFPTPADLGEAAQELALACSQNNDPTGALHALEIRATVLPPSASALFLTAISHDKLHHVKLAIEAYKGFLAASDGKNPDEEFEAKHRLVALDHLK